MARNLVERLAAAMSPRARIADNETLLADLKAEQARLEVARDQAAAESVDFTLSEDDREEAAAKAGRLDRTIKGLEGEIAKIAALIEERRSDDARKAAEAEKRAALTERNEIAARFAERVPAITAELIEIFKAVNSNADRMRAAGVHEANAEWHARGISGNGMVGVTPVMEFTKMKIPEFAGAARAWPVDTFNAMMGARADQIHTSIVQGREDAERKAKAKAEAAAEYRRTHARYELTVEGGVGMNEEVVFIPEDLVGGNIPAAMGPWDRRQLVLSHEVAKALAAVPRLQVKRLDGARK